MSDLKRLCVEVDIESWYANQTQFKTDKLALHINPPVGDDESATLSIFTDDGNGNGNLILTFPLKSNLMPY